MNRVAPGYPKRRRASLFAGSCRGPGSYEQRRANIDAGSPEVVAPASPPASYEQPRAKICQTSADSTCRRPRVSNPAHANPEAFAVRWEPPHSCGGGALQRSEIATPHWMRFSAGPFGASPSSSFISERSNPINWFPPAARNPARSSRARNAPTLDQKPSGRNMNLSRVEMNSVLCFVRVTGVSIRPHVSVRNPRFATVFAASPSLPTHHDAPQNTAPAPRTSRQNVCHDLRVNQSHG